MSFIAEFADAYVALGLENANSIYLNERPPDVNTNCTVLSAYDGIPSAYMSAADRYIQVAVYDTSQASALAKADAAFNALHRKHNWTLLQWRVIGMFAKQTPFALPSVQAQGERLYRVVFNVRCIVVPKA